MHSVTAIGTDHNTGPSHIHLEPSTSAREKEERRNGGACESTETHKTPPEEKQWLTEKSQKLTTIDKREKGVCRPSGPDLEGSIGQNTKQRTKMPETKADKIKESKRAN